MECVVPSKGIVPDTTLKLIRQSSIVMMMIEAVSSASLYPLRRSIKADGASN